MASADAPDTCSAGPRPAVVCLPPETQARISGNASAWGFFGWAVNPNVTYGAAQIPVERIIAVSQSWTSRTATTTTTTTTTATRTLSNSLLPTFTMSPNWTAPSLNNISVSLTSSNSSVQLSDDVLPTVTIINLACYESMTAYYAVFTRNETYSKACTIKAPNDSSFPPPFSSFRTITGCFAATLQALNSGNSKPTIPEPVQNSSYGFAITTPTNAQSTVVWRCYNPWDAMAPVAPCPIYDIDRLSPALLQCASSSSGPNNGSTPSRVGSTDTALIAGLTATAIVCILAGLAAVFYYKRKRKPGRTQSVQQTVLSKSRGVSLGHHISRQPTVQGQGSSNALQSASTLITTNQSKRRLSVAISGTPSGSPTSPTVVRNSDHDESISKLHKRSVPLLARPPQGNGPPSTPTSSIASGHDTGSISSHLRNASVDCTPQSSPTPAKRPISPVPKQGGNAAVSPGPLSPPQSRVVVIPATAVTQARGGGSAASQPGTLLSGDSEQSALDAWGSLCGRIRMIASTIVDAVESGSADELTGDHQTNADSAPSSSIFERVFKRKPFLKKPSEAMARQADVVAVEHLLSSALFEDLFSGVLDKSIDRYGQIVVSSASSSLSPNSWSAPIANSSSSELRIHERDVWRGLQSLLTQPNFDESKLLSNLPLQLQQQSLFPIATTTAHLRETLLAYLPRSPPAYLLSDGMESLVNDGVKLYVRLKAVDPTYAVVLPARGTALDHALMDSSVNMGLVSGSGKAEERDMEARGPEGAVGAGNSGVGKIVATYAPGLVKGAGDLRARALVWVDEVPDGVPDG
ncbi:hypothetical protein BJ742DRAFT_342121 [Cladochytrium replicatum]|nr:hypothetical protein BJ742DRAFT_342121 [Cladochytrium replicatum]